MGPHSNNCLCILKHLLNHICVTEALTRPQKPVSCLSAGLAAEPSTIPCIIILLFTIFITPDIPNKEIFITLSYCLPYVKLMMYLIKEILYHYLIVYPIY